LAEEQSGERTEDPTPQRREDFRKRGQVAQSREVASVMILFAVALTIWGAGRFFLQEVFEIFSVSFTDYLLMAAREGDWRQAAQFAAIKGLYIVGPVALIGWLMGVASTVVQVGFLYNEEALKFDVTKIDPVQGLQRIFSLRSLVEGIKAVLKVSLVLAIVVAIFRSEIDTLPKLLNYGPQQIMLYLGHLSLKLLLATGAFMLVLAAIDFFYQRWDLEQKMRMTKQEVKEELKQREGDPLVRARIRKLQREVASRRMMADVKKADVIITNPTHIAVALVYSATVIAPKLVAKGADEIAERIKATAREANIPVIENKPLARAIYKTLKIGQIIPKELYNAVAEVLSYVYKLKKKKLV
jgi:flagellar biosynthesis protein FlhB